MQFQICEIKHIQYTHFTLPWVDTSLHCIHHNKLFQCQPPPSSAIHPHTPDPKSQLIRNNSNIFGLQINESCNNIVTKQRTNNATNLKLLPSNTLPSPAASTSSALHFFNWAEDHSLRISVVCCNCQD